MCLSIIHYLYAFICFQMCTFYENEKCMDFFSVKYLTPDHLKACDSTMQDLANSLFLERHAGDLEPTVHDEYVFAYIVQWYRLRNYMCMCYYYRPGTGYLRYCSKGAGFSSHNCLRNRYRHYIYYIYRAGTGTIATFRLPVPAL